MALFPHAFPLRYVTLKTLSLPPYGTLPSRLSSYVPLKSHSLPPQTNLSSCLSSFATYIIRFVSPLGGVDSLRQERAGGADGRQLRHHQEPPHRPAARTGGRLVVAADQQRHDHRPGEVHVSGELEATGETHLSHRGRG